MKKTKTAKSGAMKQILGVRDANGNIIPLSEVMKNQKKFLALHFHPDAIRKAVNELHEQSISDKNSQEIQFIFEDIKNLVNWALDKMPIVKPPKDENE